MHRAQRSLDTNNCVNLVHLILEGFSSLNRSMILFVQGKENHKNIT